jgi:hypothetical protein
MSILDSGLVSVPNLTAMFLSAVVGSFRRVFSKSFFHGAKADLIPGDLITVGYQSNFTEAKPLSWVYFTGTLDAAFWALSTLEVAAMPQNDASG